MAHLIEEINNSKHILEDQLHLSVQQFAYLGGTFTEQEMGVVEEAVYLSAVIVGGRWGNGHETSLYSLHRKKILQGDNILNYW